MNCTVAARTPFLFGARRLLAVMSLALAACTCSTTPVVTPVQADAAARLLPVDRAVVQSLLEAAAKELLVPGAVVLLRTPDGEVAATYGVGTRGEATPVSLDQHIRVGSNTKTWTGTVTLQLAQEGRLRLSDPVSKYRADVPNGSAITIEQLLNMRSGLFNYSETLELNRALDQNPQKVWTPDELLALAWAHPPYFAPGEGYHYSNTNTVLLGLIAEQLDGKPLEAIFRERLFAPLGMTGTLLPARSSSALPSPHPRGYMYGTNELTHETPALPAAMQKDAAEGKLLPGDHTDANPSWGWAAGAGISTARDLATWVGALTGGALLGPELQRLRMESLRPQSAENPDGALYGLGIAQFGKLYGHTGELPGFNTFMGNDPVNGVTLIVWTNLAPAVDGRNPATTIAKGLIDHVYRTADTTTL